MACPVPSATIRSWVKKGRAVLLLGGNYHEGREYPSSPGRSAVNTPCPEYLLRHLRRLVPPLASDAALLDAFVRRRDEDSFSALVARHGPMV